MTSTSQRLRVAVFVSGRGSNLRALLDAKAAGALPSVEFVLVFADKPAPPAFEHAALFNIPTASLLPKSFATKPDFEAAVIDRLEEVRADFIVLAGYMRIVGPTLLARFPQKIINIHPSLLPSFPGLDAQKQAFNYGVKVSGCTVHFVDGGVDSGPIILQETVALSSDDTPESLSQKILELEHKALPAALNAVAEGRVRVSGRHVLIVQS